MIKIKKLKTNLLGQRVTKDSSNRGRQIERILEIQGFDINHGHGPDLKLNADTFVEIKSRDNNATSPQTVGAMTLNEIKNTDYEDSRIFNKFQQQYRVKTENGIIVEESMYDFSGWFAQSLIKEAYETARQSIIGGACGDYIPGGTYGYFERVNKKSKTSYHFRLSNSAMKKLEAMANSTINQILEII
jgi:hypothetical protein